MKDPLNSNSMSLGSRRELPTISSPADAPKADRTSTLRAPKITRRRPRSESFASLYAGLPQRIKDRLAEEFAQVLAEEDGAAVEPVAAMDSVLAAVSRMESLASPPELGAV